MNLEQSKKLDDLPDLQPSDTALSRAKEILVTELTRISQVLANEGRIFYEDHKIKLDRIVIIPNDYTLRHGAEFDILLVQKEVAVDSTLEDILSNWNIDLSKRYENEHFYVRTILLPYCVSDEAYSSLAEVMAANAIRISNSNSPEN